MTTNGPTNNTVLEIRIYQHSDLIYWWVVWLYGFFASGLTYLDHDKVTIGQSKEIWIYSQPWLGVSFLLLVLFVVVATNAKARGSHSLVLLLILLLLAVIGYTTNVLEKAIGLYDYLLVFMSFEFYILFSSILFVAWILVTIILEHQTYWYFSRNNVGERWTIGGGQRGYSPQAFSIEDHPYDLFVNRILGLEFIGLGTGDVSARFTVPGQEIRVDLKNVLRAWKKTREIERLVPPA